MFDKITIKIKCSDDECAHFARVYSLLPIVDKNGEIIKYISGEEHKIKNRNITIKTKKGNVFEMSLSLHKYWNDMNYGKLKNDDTFTMSEAKSAFERLLFENGFVAKRVKITYFEIGLNLETGSDPIEFIKLCKNATQKKGMYIDANYQINRQKTTEKHKFFRKVWKIYDKGWEMLEKQRGIGKPLQPDRNILRIETMHRRTNHRAEVFFSDKNLTALKNQFRLDWRDLRFERKVRADKGARENEIENARRVFVLGVEAVIEAAKTAFKNSELSEKRCRTICDFCKKWKNNSDFAKRFKEILSEQEMEYRRLFNKQYSICVL